MREKKRVDEEWKRRAEEEKAKIAAASEPPAAAPVDPARGEAAGDAPADATAADADSAEAAPPPRGQDQKFMMLLSQLGSQAMAGLGQIPDPRTGQPHLDLQLAREAIDLLTVLEEKTRGNLSADEDATLKQLLHELRFVYADVARAIRERATETPPPQ